MPRAFLLRRDFEDSTKIRKGKLPFIHQDEKRPSSGDDYPEVGRRKRPAKARKDKSDDEFFYALQKKTKSSYPADDGTDGRVNDTGKILSSTDDFINNEKKMSEHHTQKNILPELHLAVDHGIFQENGALPAEGKYEKTSPGTAVGAPKPDFKHLTTQAVKKYPQLNKANDLSTTSARQRTDKTIHRCNQCGKIFKTKYTLSIHLKMPDHTQSRPFVCNVCGKGFRLSSTLCRHKIIHTEKKPHKCEECGKSFNRSSTLKTHLRTHSDKKAFICDICGKGFHQKGNLRNHIMIHTGEKPFRCDQCNRAFNKMSNLKFHLHTHSDNLPYHCRTCRKRFAKKSDLNEHVDEVH
ncbi:fez family zinc finger protein 1-like [Acropora muricata]|uniref:fez family zinc finger protein 1-like n=1 Tax=Acropora muricata TaxID=159855 RepID=UPI0034E53A84